MIRATHFVVTVTVQRLEAEGGSVAPDDLVDLVNPLHHLLAVHWLVGQQAPDLAWKNK